MLNSNTWNHVTVSKEMSLFDNLFYKSFVFTYDWKNLTVNLFHQASQ